MKATAASSSPAYWPPKRFVIVSSDLGIAGALRGSLGQHFPGVRCEERTAAELGRLAPVIGGTDWLLATEEVPTHKVGGEPVSQFADRSGWDAAAGWVQRRSQGGLRRAIVITNTSRWEPHLPTPSLRNGVMALPMDRVVPFCCALEIIQAGGAGQDFVPPTITHLSLRPRGDQFCLRLEEDPEGPFSAFVRRRLGPAARRGQPVPDFLKTAGVAKIEGLLEPGAFLAALRKYSEHVYDTEGSLLRKLVESAHEAAVSLTRDQRDSHAADIPLCPVHLHVHWKQKRCRVAGRFAPCCSAPPPERGPPSTSPHTAWDRNQAARRDLFWLQRALGPRTRRNWSPPES